MRVYYDRDADINLIKGKKVAVVGYGSQGTRTCSTCANPASRTSQSRCARPRRRRQGGEGEAEGDGGGGGRQVGRRHHDAHPDELQADIYKDHLAANMKDGAA
jgi:ketol-acid reductoisomerase